ncbi:DoxX family protein [Erythrobacter crassostreae]|uniref:DoxX family protein n=1 Tax=Erythrobacter crassostreae TaxID=2828328 RepID=A0A9X1F0D5_9SPHN|nr:DoxX family protein [Erythrobacter crassostrea]MBV7258027.1 DoxX family protein [Erythrobacter crassostrea]
MMPRLKIALRVILALFYGYAGYVHFIRPEPFLAITPDWVPYPSAVVWWTGIAEIAGAIGLLQPFSKQLRQAAGIGLALYALCVWPANINHFMMDMGRADGGLGLGYHVPRMIAQPIIIWLALWVGGVVGAKQQP